MTRRYLITGAQGQVGRYLAARILEVEEGAFVVGIGRSPELDESFPHRISTGDGTVLAPLPVPLRRVASDRRYRYQPMSLLETSRLRELLSELQPHCVFHLASALHTAPERELFATNIEGTASLMNAVAEAQGAGARVVFASSGSVYGAPASLPIREDHPCAPTETYGVTKLAAEHLARVKASRSGAALVTARIFNVLAPGQDEEHVCTRLSAQVARQASKLEVGALDTTRDFIDARDVAAGLLLLAHAGESGATYNLASGRETPIHFIVAELVRLSGLSDRVELVRRANQLAGVPRHVADVSRLQRLGFAPSFSLTESLRDLLGYYRSINHSRSGTSIVSPSIATST